MKKISKKTEKALQDRNNLLLKAKEEAKNNGKTERYFELIKEADQILLNTIK